MSLKHPLGIAKNRSNQEPRPLVSIGTTKGIYYARFENQFPHLGVGLSLIVWCITILDSRFTVPRVTPTILSKLGTLT